MLKARDWRAIMNWLVAVADFGSEILVQETLHRQGFECYFPKYRERRVVRGRRLLVEKYLFGRYFFVKIVDAWRKLVGMRGVREVLMCGEKPKPVPSRIISEIRSREDGEGFIKMLPPGRRTRFRRGQPVRVRQGTLIGYCGLFDRELRGDRVRVLFEFMGKTAAVLMRAETLSVI